MAERVAKLITPQPSCLKDSGWQRQFCPNHSFSHLSVFQWQLVCLWNHSKHFMRGAEGKTGRWQNWAFRPCCLNDWSDGGNFAPPPTAIFPRIIFKFSIGKDLQLPAVCWFFWGNLKCCGRKSWPLGPARVLLPQTSCCYEYRQP